MKQPIIVLAFLIAAGFFWNGCSPIPNADKIINKAIAAHGGEKYQNSKIEFTFRGKRYSFLQKGGSFRYRATFRTPEGTVADELTNAGFKRTIDGEQVSLSDIDRANYSSSLNSVIYFALLPYHLNDPAVQKEFIGESVIKGEPYYKIRVTFRKEGGGQDYNDRFVYWIHLKKYTMDYLAYSYNVNESGTRFREAVNAREINGIRFADYINYEGPGDEKQIENFDKLFAIGKLKKLSEINLENIVVSERAN